MIALVRHGAYNLKTGSLTEEGRAQGNAVAEQLSRYAEWTDVVASPSERTQETARIIGEKLKIPVRIEEIWGKPQATEDCRKNIHDNVVYVTHYPILTALVPGWDPKVGEAKELRRTDLDTIG